MFDWTHADVGVPWAPAPESVGVSREGLQRLENLMQRTIDEHQFPCASALVLRKGKAVFYKGVGKALTESGTPLQHDSLYRIYSMSKPITSLALLMLLEEGRVTLEQPAHVFLGDKWRRQNMKVLEGEGRPLVPCERTITVRHLLTHTAGLSYGFELEPANPVDELYRKSSRGALKRNENLAELVDRISELPLCHQPGTQWNYSYATDVVGRIVEVISGQSLGQFLRERILEPLGMKDTAFHLEPEPFRRLVSLHVELPGGAKQDVTAVQNKYKEFTPHKRMESGGGGLVSSVRDYARFAQFCLNGGELDGRRLLGRKTFAWATSNHLPGGKDLAALAHKSCQPIYGVPGLGFGLGFAVVMDAPLTARQGSSGSFYWSGAASTLFLCDPKEELALVFMTQVLFRDEIKMPLRVLVSNVVYSALADDDKSKARL